MKKLIEYPLVGMSHEYHFRQQWSEDTNCRNRHVLIRLFLVFFSGKVDSVFLILLHTRDLLALTIAIVI